MSDLLQNATLVTHALTLADFWDFKIMGTLALSPDGRRVAFVMQSTDQASNENRSAVYLLQLDEQGHARGAPRQLTNGIKHDTSPAWAPDSRRLLFLSDREEGNQLWLIDTDGGEPRKLTSMQHGVTNAQWSPDGKWIAFTAPVAATDEHEVLTGQNPLDEAAKKKYDEEERLRLHVVTTVFYRVDGAGLFEKFEQLFLMLAPDTDGKTAPEQIRRLTSGDYSHMLPQWTPDSVEIGFLCNRNEKRDQTFTIDLWTINHESGEQRCLTDSTLEIDCYSWSPDGNSVAVVASKDQMTYGRRNERLYLVTRKGNVGDNTLLLTPDLDRETCPVVGSAFGLPGPYCPVWSQDGQTLYFLVADRGCVHVYSIEVVWRTLRQLTTGETMTSYLALLPAANRLLLVQGQAEHPWELFTHDLSSENGTQERLTHLYDRQMVAYRFGEKEHFRYKGVNNDDIDGWLIKPVGARAGVRYPLAVRIHGGPHGAFGIGFDLVNQYLTGQGFAVFYCNPHGSTTCGEEFMREVLGDWGGWDFQDILLGVDECIGRGAVDTERMVVTGYSYGGFMSMFIIGHSDRFKAAVPMAGVSNLASFVGTKEDT